MTHHKQTNTLPTFETKYENSYGQFIALSEENEIVCYSRNGNAIYYNEDPPTTPFKKKQSKHEKVNIHSSDIPRYDNRPDSKLVNREYIIKIMYGTLTVALAIIALTSLYFIFIRVEN